MHITPKLTVSVVIPVYNGGDGFRRCLLNLQQSQRLPDELIVVADGDTDGSWQVAEECGATVLRFLTAGGPARARNRGAQIAQGDILFFVDADVAVHPSTISLVEQAFQQEPDLSALIGSYDEAPGAENFLSQYKNLFHHYTHQTSSDEASTFWGACGAIRRSVFLTFGGFDEQYRKPSIEDVELGYRLKQAGHKIRLCKNIQVKHLKQWNPISLLKADIFYRALPWTQLILRDRLLINDLNLNTANRLSVILTFSLVVCLVLTWCFSQLLIVAALLSVGLLIINAQVYLFFYHKRGLLFALRVIPWHWLYFLYSGATFAYGIVSYYFHLWRFPKASSPVAFRKMR